MGERDVIALGCKSAGPPALATGEDPLSVDECIAALGAGSRPRRVVCRRSFQGRLQLARAECSERLGHCVGFVVCGVGIDANQLLIPIDSKTDDRRDEHLLRVICDKRGHRSHVERRPDAHAVVVRPAVKAFEDLDGLVMWRGISKRDFVGPASQDRCVDHPLGFTGLECFDLTIDWLEQ